PHRRCRRRRRGAPGPHRLQARLPGPGGREGERRPAHARRPAPALRGGGRARPAPRETRPERALPLDQRRRGHEGGRARQHRRAGARPARAALRVGAEERLVPARPRRRQRGLPLLRLRHRLSPRPAPVAQGGRPRGRAGARRRAGRRRRARGGGRVNPAETALAADGAGLTREQARAALAPGSVAVVAGAGTGKTKMLAHRYLHHLEEGLSPLEVVAVTFTEKAAAELRSRIRALVRAQRPHDRRSLVELEAAQISTIHALAARVCRDHPEEAQVAPDFTVLDDVEGVMWRAERLEEAIASLPAEVVDAVPVGLLRTVLERLLDDPLDAAPALERGPDDWRALLEREREAAWERIAADPRWREWRATLTTYRGADGDKAEDARRSALAALDALLARDPAAALAAAAPVDLRGGKEGAWPGGGMRAAKEAAKAVRDAVREACGSAPLALEWGEADELFARLLPHLRTAYEHASSHLERARRADRVLGFADMELHALRALEHEHVRAHYRERWKALLVDEFQDTNPVQARLLGRLIEGARVTVV